MHVPCKHVYQAMPCKTDKHEYRDLAYSTVISLKCEGAFHAVIKSLFVKTSKMFKSFYGIMKYIANPLCHRRKFLWNQKWFWKQEGGPWERDLSMKFL